MRCEQARQALSEARYAGGELDPLAQKHLGECAECRAFAEAGARLDQWLSVDRPVEPRPGFDTRFFARLAQVKAERSESRQGLGRALGQWALLRRRWLLAAAPLAAAAALALVFTRTSGSDSEAYAILRVPVEDQGLMRDMELVKNLDLVRQLDEVETFEVLADLELSDFDRALGSADQAPDVQVPFPSSGKAVNRAMQ